MVVFGHSFVARLKDSQFNEYNAKLFGLPGGQARSIMNKFIFKDVLEYRPDFCFIQIGGNDITDTSDAIEIVNSISEIVKRLQEHGTVVAIGEIMPRSKPWPPLTPQSYENIRIAINMMLKQKYSQDMIVSYHDIDFHHLDKDGVHLNNLGTSVFINAIKQEFDKYLISS